ncbi:hypothetical protein GNP79_06965 [Aliivibrio fischeri]|uniref:Uncharacterized protein n=1 Tax=Aliivibrio fischeri TaxID=668 RepID=A0A6N3Z541_ALIFS|nr:hypothetical protein [Aliivibrio fischeri]MUK44885.1 hypothetical protein [Aliivibrio fischeri]MUK80544.1 hypothetical protein [Aliivibrio fischeri]MUK84447.1 hypothetical protein [Aliivibrio fischeri]
MRTYDTGLISTPLHSMSEYKRFFVAGGLSDKKEYRSYRLEYVTTESNTQYSQFVRYQMDLYHFPNQVEPETK